MRVRPLLTAAVVLVLAAAVGACAKQDHAAAKAPLTEHQRDSVLATEPIPGAPGVGAALKAAEIEAGHAAGMDSLGR